jgi:hypothetical protein
MRLRAFDYLRIFGFAVLIISGLFVTYLIYIKAEPMVWIGAFTIIAEGFGFIGLSLVELSLFLKGKELAELNAPQFAIEFDPEDHDQYTPELIVEEASLVGKPRLERKFLKVAVRNLGLGVAQQCKATLQVLTKDERMIIPSGEPKELRWESGTTRQDIGAVNGRERVVLVLSDSRIGASTGNRFAYVCTPGWLESNPLGLFRNQDGMGLGDFEFYLLVTESRTGHQYGAKFRVRVTENWRKLSMARLS